MYIFIIFTIRPIALFFGLMHRFVDLVATLSKRYQIYHPIDYKQKSLTGKEEQTFT